MELSVEPLTPTIGAVISGVDLSRSLEPATIKEIESALLDHLVVFFRDQKLSDVEFRDFGRCFGKLSVHPFLENMGGELEEIHLIDYDPRRGDSYRADTWHTDATFLPEPPMGSILSPIRIPEVGGDTLWANMYAAYDQLSPRLKDLLAGLDATHSTGGGTWSADAVRHPVVRTHPVTKRKGLFVNEIFTKEIHGLGRREGQDLLQTLFRHCLEPLFQVRWRWRMGDIAFWDNRCTQHYGVFDYPSQRVLRRLTLSGDRPE